jgi:hypothetical protein
MATALAVADQVDRASATYEVTQIRPLYPLRATLSGPLVQLGRYLFAVPVQAPPRPHFCRGSANSLSGLW